MELPLHIARLVSQPEQQHVPGLAPFAAQLDLM
jgi:hypothetical protein